MVRPKTGLAVVLATAMQYQQSGTGTLNQECPHDNQTIIASYSSQSYEGGSDP